MKVLLFTPADQIDADRIARHYPIPGIITYPIDITLKAADLRARIKKSSKSINSLGITHIIVLAANLFKILTKEKKVGLSYGKLLPSKLEGFEGIKIAIAPSYQSLFYNPANALKIQMTLDAVIKGEKQYTVIKGIYPKTVQEVRQALEGLHAYDRLGVDIEGHSLQYTQAQVGTIAFAWNHSEGIAFPGQIEGTDLGYLLAEFFQSFRGKIVFHNSPYDVSVLVYELFMQHKLDYRGMLDALDIFYRDCDDTKLMVYLNKNSTTEISLKLKENIIEEYGDYGVDVKDISLIPMPELLTYNLTDACGTLWLMDKDMPLLKKNNLIKLYTEKFMPAQKVLTYMEMVGMPMVAERIAHARSELEKIIQDKLNVINSFTYIQDVEQILKENKVIEDNKKLKNLVRTLENVKPIPFNPGSNQHLGILFHDVMGLPIIDTTPTGQPGTGEDTIKKLLRLLEK